MKKILQKIYFLESSNSLFTINGADGGKSSILNKISNIVELFPFEVTLIHHNKGGEKINHQLLHKKFSEKYYPMLI